MSLLVAGVLGALAGSVITTLIAHADQQDNHPEVTISEQDNPPFYGSHPCHGAPIPLTIVHWAETNLIHDALKHLEETNYIPDAQRVREGILRFKAGHKARMIILDARYQCDWCHKHDDQDNAHPLPTGDWICQECKDTHEVTETDTGISVNQTGQHSMLGDPEP